VTQTVTEIGRRNGNRLLRISETGSANTDFLFSRALAAGGRLLGVNVAYSASPTHSGVGAYVGRPFGSVNLTAGTGSVQSRDISSYAAGTKVVTLADAWRSNRNKYSSDYSQIYWTKAGSTIITDAEIAPDGTSTADILADDNSTGPHQIRAALSSGIASAGSPLCMSVYLKAIAGASAQLLLYNPTDGSFGRIGVNLDTGTTFNEIGTAYGATDVGNGWWRVYCSGTPTTAASGSANVYIYSRAAASTSYAGTSSLRLAVWGVQHELATTPGEYIETTANAILYPAAGVTYNVLDDLSGGLSSGAAAAIGASSITLAAHPIFGRSVLAGSANSRYTTMNGKHEIGEGDEVRVLAPAGGAGITAAVAAYVEV
jgi:hypothetical protein